MKRFDIITIFPKIFDSYFGESIVKRAQKNEIIEINVHNLRDYTTDKHKTVDDTPYGGGAGMVLKIEPIYRCVQFLKSEILNPKSETNSKLKIKNSKRNKKIRTILFSAKGKRYTQKDAKRLAKYDQLIFICGRYEGVDERVAKYIADEEISIGDYVLTGGEIPAMVVIDSITRLLPGVLGNPKSLDTESFSMVRQKADAESLGEIKNFEELREFPQYTKPEKFSAKGGSQPKTDQPMAGAISSGGNSWKVPKILLSGNHGEIEKWRKKKST